VSIEIIDESQTKSFTPDQLKWLQNAFIFFTIMAFRELIDLIVNKATCHAFHLLIFRRTCSGVSLLFSLPSVKYTSATFVNN